MTSTTDHAASAFDAGRRDPGTRADAGGFDRMKPFRTRGGQEAVITGETRFRKIEYHGHIDGEPMIWDRNGSADGGRKVMDDDLVNVDPAAPDPIPQAEGDAPLALTFTYRNHRGEVGVRHVRPLAVRCGATDWHPEPQWLLRAFDLDKGAEREFAMKDIGAVNPSPASREAILKEACKPWEHSIGDAPDWDSPLHQVFVAGMLYTEQLLANALDVDNFERGDGSEDFDADATTTLLNILVEAGAWDPDENTLRAPLAPARGAGAAAGGEDDAVALLEAWRAFSPTTREGTGDMRAACKAYLARRGARPHEPADASARSAARTWLHAYGIKTERYTPGDHPAMQTLPAAFEAFASARLARGEVADAVLAELDRIKNRTLAAFNTDYRQGKIEALQWVVGLHPTDVLDRARPAGQGEGDGWLPIATAPKDGTRVWVFSPGHDQVVAWWDAVDGGGHPENGPLVFWWVSDHVEFLDGPYDAPTHWRPLPTPPSAAAPPAPASREDEAAFVRRMDRTMRPDRLPEEDARLRELARRATSAPSQDAGPAGVTEAALRDQDWEEDVRDLEAARTPDAGKETGR